MSGRASPAPFLAIVCLIAGPFVLLASLLGVYGGNGAGGATADTPAPPPPPPPPPPPSGFTAAPNPFSLLTYNVAGLDVSVTSRRPDIDHVDISPLLNLYDLALVQEDFIFYHHILVAQLLHPYQSPPNVHTDPGFVLAGDGLNRFSQMPFQNFTRDPWTTCAGTDFSDGDCFTSKGYSFARHTLRVPNVTVDVYNLHMDAFDNGPSIAARTAQVNQLLAAIALFSGDGQAVIVAGDTNIGTTAQPDIVGPIVDEYNLLALLQQANLTDVCRELSCGSDALIDRVMYRSSDSVLLTPLNHTIDGRFINTTTLEHLSDHRAVGVYFTWESLLW